MIDAVKKINRRRGLTLVELLAAIGIMAILLVIVFNVSSRFRASALSASCMNNLRNIGAGVQLYMNEHGNTFPNWAMGPTEEDEEGRVAMSVALLEYVGDDPRVFRCPADNRVFDEHDSSYHWNTFLNKQVPGEIQILGQSFDATRIPMVFDADSFHSGAQEPRNFLFVDGSVRNEVRFFVEE